MYSILLSFLSKLENLVKRWIENQPGLAGMEDWPKQFSFDSEFSFFSEESYRKSPWIGRVLCCWQSLSNPGISTEGDLTAGEPPALAASPERRTAALQPQPAASLVLPLVQDQTAHESEAILVTGVVQDLDF